MKRKLLPALMFLAAAGAFAADLPTVSVEHLYYLQARAEKARKATTDEMIDYCLAHKIGGPGFESLYAQISALRLDLAKLVQIQKLTDADAHVISLRKLIEVHLALLREEAQKIQNGLMQEGQVANEALAAIARAQEPR